MAAGKYQESYSSRFPNCKYQVFLSFRGEDTRKNFTDHLYTALVQAGIHTFRDDNEIQRGENIDFELQKAIQQSKISIIVFSKDYASSRWCLDELVMIMERKRNADCIVFPVFYDVGPSQVGRQTGSFAAAFVEHEKSFKDEMERVNGWRIALKEVADLAGMVLGDGYEAQFVQSIVENVSKNLDPKIFHVPLHFIGRDALVQYINSWLQDGSHGAAIALLYGIGGVGKTAIAKSVFNQNYYKFEGKSFLSNFRLKDIVCLQCKIEPLDDKKSLELFSWNAFEQVDPVDGFVEDSWRIVHHCNGLPLALRVIGSSLSGKGREIWESALQQMKVIPNFEVQKVLRVSYDFLDGDYPKNLFLDIVCFFNGMDVDDAVRILDGLDKGARFGIDNLIDRCLVEINSDQRLWMHQLVRDMGREIARQESPKCQRIWHQGDAFTVLKGTTDAEKLRGLTIDMHALMEYHYAEVVCTDSMVCRKRRRLNFFQQWLSNFFDGGKLQTGQTSLFPILSTDAFRKMPDVKFLQLNYTNFHGIFENFPKNLIWLCWHGLSWSSIPNHVCLEKLVVLDLSRSCLVDAWKGKPFLPKLKILDLRHSRDLIRTPDFSGLPALEKLILEDCISLVQIHESIGDLQRLLILNLRSCTSLMELPEEMSRLNSLQELVLDGCSNLNSLNMEVEHHQGRKLLQSDGIVASTSFTSSLPLKLFFPSRFSTRKMLRFTSFSLPRFLESLDLSGTPIRFLPESINDLGLLRHLYLKNCKMLQALSELPSHLESLDVSFCYSLQRLANPDHLVKFQDRIKQELIQKFDSHVFRIMKTIIFMDGIFNVVVYVFDEDEMLRWFHEEEEEDKWLIQNEYVDNFSFKISSSPPAHRICGFNLFISCVTSAYRGFSNVYIEIRNNTSGQSLRRQVHVFDMRFEDEVRAIQSLSHWKLGGDDPKFDSGDDVTISMVVTSAIQIRTVGVQWLHEEEGKDDDIQSKDEVIIAHNSSDDDDDDAAHVAKVELASRIFRNYYCDFHGIYSARNFTYWNFAKKGIISTVK